VNVDHRPLELGTCSGHTFEQPRRTPEDVPMSEHQQVLALFFDAQLVVARA